MNHSNYGAAVAVVFALMLQGCNAQAEKTDVAGGKAVELDTHEKRLSYATAFDFRKQISQNELPLDMDAFQAGLRDAFGDKSQRLTDAEMNAEIQIFVAELRNRLEAVQKATAGDVEPGEVNVGEQGRYLSENMLTSGVVTVQSGLQYEIIRDGDGARPQPGDRVEVHYRGTLIDGTEFDSSYTNGKPSVFPVSGLIAGWSEALLMMPVGSHWRLVIPPQLAYGGIGNGNKVPANAVLIFDVELIDVIDDTP
jgi:FKBP-type peptidyl-prolyl cis-trans isomerase